MHNLFKGLFEEWEYIRGLTTCFIENLSDAELDTKLPRKNLNTIRKHCEELIEVQKSYVKALDTGTIEFDGYSDEELPGVTSKEELLRQCNELDELLISKVAALTGDEEINWFGVKKSIYYHIVAMISHESMHIGQMVAFSYAMGIQIPQEIVNNMALSN